MIIFVAKEEIDYDTLFTSMTVLIKKINKKISSKGHVLPKEE